MYGNYYGLTNQQANLDRVNAQISELEKIKAQLTNAPAAQPTNLTQNFQFTPTNNAGIRYANTIDEVSREIIFADTPFFSKDLSILWIKNPKNEIKTYELKEIVPKDEKDLQIEYLTSRIEALEKERDTRHEQYFTNVDTAEVPTDSTEYVEPVGEPVEKSKPSSVSRVSKSKK